MDNECWLYAGRINSNGYGILNDRYVHRIMWEQYNDKIPDGMQIDHLCRVRQCINPDHLEPVSPRVNTLRGDGIAAKLARRTKCNYGHNFDSTGYQGYRRCSTCNRANAKRFYHRHKA